MVLALLLGLVPEDDVVTVDKMPAIVETSEVRLLSPAMVEIRGDHRGGGFLCPRHQLDPCVAGLMAPQVIAVPECFTAVSAHKRSFGFFFFNPNGIL